MTLLENGSQIKFIAITSRQLSEPLADPVMQQAFLCSSSSVAMELQRKKMKMGGQWAAGTTYVDFEDVKVPIENLIGVEGEGSKCLFGQMARYDEAQQAWIESIVYQLDNMSKADGDRWLGGTTALAKANCGLVSKHIVRYVYITDT